jgi:hypothetical protein
MPAKDVRRGRSDADAALAVGPASGPGPKAAAAAAGSSATTADARAGADRLRATVAAGVKTDPAAAAFVRTGRRLTHEEGLAADRAEQALYDAAMRGEPWAVGAYLVAYAADRGYAGGPDDGL